MKIRKLLQLLCMTFLLGNTVVSCKDNDEVYISITGQAKELYRYTTSQFQIEIQDKNTTLASAIWSVYDFTPAGNNTTGEVISISEDGMVTALDYGQAIIKASLPDGRYALTNVSVIERPGPNNDEIVFSKKQYYMRYTALVDSMTFSVDSALLKKYPLTFSSSDEEYLKIDNKFVTTEQSGYFKVAIFPQQKKKAEPVTISAHLGDAEATCDIYLGTALSLTLQSGLEVTERAYKLPINNAGKDTIRVYYEAFPNDENTLKEIDFKINVSGGNLVVTQHGYNEKRVGEYLIVVNTGSLTGNSDITLEALGEKVTAQCNVFDKREHPVTSVKLPVNELESYGVPYVFEIDDVNVLPFGITEYWPLEWRTSDPAVATVDSIKIGSDSEGTLRYAIQVVYHSLGDVDIIAGASDKFDKCHINVLLEVGRVAINSAKNEYFIGETDQWEISTDARFKNIPDKYITWTSDNEDVLNVVNGKITALAVGEATITVSVTDDKGKTSSASQKVTVKATDDSKIYDVTISRNDFGQYEYGISINSSQIDIFNQNTLSETNMKDYLSFTLKGLSDLSVNKTYRVGESGEISGTVYYNDVKETATLTGGTIQVINNMLVINIQVRKGSKIVNIIANN